MNSTEEAKITFLEALEKEDIVLVSNNTINRDNIWIKERKKRLCSSNFGQICKMRPTTSTTNIVKSILYEPYVNTFMIYAKNKSEALQQFQKDYNIQVENSGLQVCSEFKFLACTLDGKVGDKKIVTVQNNSGIGSILNQVEKKKISYLKITEDKKFELKKNHNIYYKIQGQLNITKRDVCYFVVWSPREMLVEEISRDEQFWKEKMVPKLKRFYMEALLPEIVDPRYKNQLYMIKWRNVKRL